MLARKCDFCGVLYEYNNEESNAIMFANRDLNNHYHEHQMCDVCSTCMKRAVEMLNTLTPKGNTTEEQPSIIVESRIPYTGRGSTKAKTAIADEIQRIAESMAMLSETLEDGPPPAELIIPTVKTMRECIARYCNAHQYCEECVIHNLPGHKTNCCYSPNNTNDTDIIMHYLAIKREEANK